MEYTGLKFNQKYVLELKELLTVFNVLTLLCENIFSSALDYF